MSTVAVVNSEGLEISGKAKKNIMETFEYETFGEISGELKGRGLIFDSYTYLEQYSAKDEAGITMATPCPSKVNEWSDIIGVAMRDVSLRGIGKPAKIYLPGSNRPMLCQKSDESGGGYYFACGCEDCTADKDMETVSEILYTLSEEKNFTPNDYLREHAEFQRLAQERAKLCDRFDDAMKKAVLKVFPRAEVCFYVDVKANSYPGSYSVTRKDYAVYPCMTDSKYAGEFFLRERDDFQLAAVKHGQRPMLLKLPLETDDNEFYDIPDDLQAVAASILGERASVREIAERFLNTVFAGGA